MCCLATGAMRLSCDDAHIYHPDGKNENTQLTAARQVQELPYKFKVKCKQKFKYYDIT